MLERLIGPALGITIAVAALTAITTAQEQNGTEVEITNSNTKPSLVNIVVCIEWEDAVGYAETWIELEEALELEPGVSLSCGLLLGEANGRVYIAMDRSSDGLYAGISSIPTGWVITKTVEE